MRLRERLPLLLTLALPALLVLPTALRGHVPWFMDVWMQFYPIRLEAARQVGEGLVPLWNPTYYCGTPLLANPQWGLFQPTLWPFLIFPNGFTYTVGVYLIPHVIFAAGGWWLGRGLFTSRVAAMAVGLSLAMGGWTWAHYPFGAYLQAVCWAPWVVGCLERHARGESGRWILAGGALWAMQLLAGAPQAVFHCGQVYLALAICFAILHRSARPIGFLFATCAWALALSATQLAPTIDFLRQTVRSGALPLEAIQQGTLNLFGEKSLWNALVGGNVYNPAEGEDAESTIYIGWLGLVLIACNLIPRGKTPSRPVWPYAVALGLTFLWAWRALAPVLHPWMPGYGHFHNPMRILLGGHLMLAVLIGAGVERLRNWEKAPPRGTLFIGLTVLFLAILPSYLSLQANLIRVEGFLTDRHLTRAGDLFGWMNIPDWEILKFTVGLGVPMAVVLLIVQRVPRTSQVLAMVSLFAFVLGLGIFAHMRLDTKTHDAPQPSVISLRLRNASNIGGLPGRVISTDDSPAYSYRYQRGNVDHLLIPNMASVHGLLDAQGYDPAIPVRVRVFFDVLNRGHWNPYPSQMAIARDWFSPLIDLLAVAGANNAGWWEPFFDEPLDHPPPMGGKWDHLNVFIRAESSALGETTEYHRFNINTTAQPRLVHRSGAVVTPDLRAAVQAIQVLGDEVRDTAVLEIPYQDPRRVPDRGSSLTLHDHHESPTVLEYDIEAPLGWIILRDTYLPGWRAFLDGYELPIIPADIMFRGVNWPEGRHTLRFEYRPTAFRFGWFVSLVAGMIFLAAWVSRRRGGPCQD